MNFMKQNSQNFQQFQEEENENPNYKRLKSRSLSLGATANKTIHRTILSKSTSKNIILKMNEMISDYPEKYYKQYLKSDLIKLLKNILASFIHVIIILLYLNSIQACPKTISLKECIEKIDIHYYHYVTFKCFICGILISLIIILVISKIIHIFHIFIIIAELILFICFSHKNNIYNNGLFSFKLLLEFMFMSFAFFLFFSLFLIKLKKKHFFYSTFFFFAFH